jgi:hypothetical protein
MGNFGGSKMITFKINKRNNMLIYQIGIHKYNYIVWEFGGRQI